jgi:biofilm PGA synthesis N-glycosyltransferase PgaC
MVEALLLWITFSLTAVYVILLIKAQQGLNRLNNPLTDTVHTFSIIVAARNEEQHVTTLLHSLLSIDYPADKFEIILINDRSTDKTQQILESVINDHSNITLLNITENPSPMPHKKNALRYGIEKASNEILAFTDADCVVPKEWLKKLNEQFTDDVGVVAGYSPFAVTESALWFHSFLRYEELKSTLGAAAGTGLQSAYMCTGRNLAYRKTVYDEVGGFEKIQHSISGDDDLFIQRVQETTQWNIRYMTSPHSYVMTQPPKNFDSFVNQRIRHISASKYYALKVKLIFALSHLLLLSIVLSFFFIPLYALVFLLVRFNMDALLITKGKELFGEEFSVVEFFRNEVLLILYTLFIGPLGLVTTFDWKGASA